MGSHDEIASLDDLDPIYKQLLDRPIACVLGVIGGDGRANLTPMWFDYEGDTVLVNVATHRKKMEWIREQPAAHHPAGQPRNPYHWLSIKCTVQPRGLEDDPEDSERVTAQLDRIWTKYTQQTRPTACAIRRSTSAGCCSSARSTGSPRSASRDEPADGDPGPGGDRRRIAGRADRGARAARPRPT